MALVIQPVVLPSSLVGQPNGRLASPLLINVHGGGSLHILAARAWRALVAACEAEGLPLTYTYGGTYRTYSSQLTLFLSRYESCSYATYLITPSERRKIWSNNPDGKKYWRKKKLANGTYPATAAAPGTSNHGLGLAIDTAFDRDLRDGVGPDDATSISSHPKFNWFSTVAVPAYGFSFELQSEPWHIRYVKGDNLPHTVLSYEAGNGIPIPPPPVNPNPNPTPGVFYVQEQIQKGSRNADVYALQAVLKLKAGQKISVDGDFGAQTEAALINFQRFFNLPADGVCGPLTWKTVNLVANL